MSHYPYKMQSGLFDQEGSTSFFFGSSRQKHNGTTIGRAVKRNTKWDVHNELYHRFTMVYITSGSGQFIDHTGKKYTLDRGSLFIRHPYYTHSSFINPDTGWEEYFVSFGSHMIPIIQQLNILKSDIHCTNIGYHESITTSFDTFLNDLKNNYTHKIEEIEYRMLGLMMDLSKFIQHSNRSEEDEDCVNLCIQHIHKNLSSKKNIEDILQAIPFSYSYLRKLFKNQMGISLRQYWIEAKVDEACSLLIGKTYTVSEIADYLGYPDPYTFSKQFKKVTSYTPSEFRKHG